MKTIDGSRGEGGGQILRTSMALAAITGTPLRLVNIRANRSKPGLARQHLTAIRATAEVCGGELRGDEMRATEVEFRPGEVAGGEYHFAVGTAGSAALVLQTVVPALLAAGQSARVFVEGGTHAKSAPPYLFLQEAYGGAVRAMGAHLEVELDYYGFFPEGGGKIEARLDAADSLEPLHYDQHHPFDRIEVTVIVSNTPEFVAERQLDLLRGAFDDLDLAASYDIVTAESRSSGNVLHVRLMGDALTEVFTEFGERGRSAEETASRLAKRVSLFLDTGAPVGPHLADQLLVLLAVGAGGSFRTVPLTLHSKTMLEIIPEFVDVSFDVTEEEGTVLVEVQV